MNAPNTPEIEITPQMIEAAAEVILSRAGDEWARIDWATRIAEAALEAALMAKDRPHPIAEGEGKRL